jgi:hypothetical protein
MAHWLAEEPVARDARHAAQPALPRDAARNRLLAQLAAFDDNFRVTPLRRRFSVGQAWPADNAEAHTVVFPLSTVATLIQESVDGQAAPLAIIGNEGVWDPKAFVHPRRHGQRKWVVHASGDALVVDRSHVVAAGHASEDVHRMLCNWDRVLLERVAQSALCNRHHDVQQQVASWLLVNQRRYKLGELAVTQTILAHLLGLRRESVSRCIGRLAAARAVTAEHNVLAVANAARLKVFACECYQAGSE